jgi:hypothetical protein
MNIKYTNIYHSKAIQNFPKFGIFGLKTNHLATLVAAGWALQSAPSWFISKKYFQIRSAAASVTCFKAYLPGDIFLRRGGWG